MIDGHYKGKLLVTIEVIACHDRSDYCSLLRLLLFIIKMIDGQLVIIEVIGCHYKGDC